MPLTHAHDSNPEKNVTGFSLREDEVALPRDMLVRTIARLEGLGETILSAALKTVLKHPKNVR
jgi:hypothetical protein